MNKRVQTGFKQFEKFTASISKPKPKKIKIAIVGKYFATGDYKLSDSYVSVVEALKHASWKLKVDTEMVWIDSDLIDKKGAKVLKEYDAIVVPQGWGSRGTEGKISAIKFAREEKIPYLGLCFGMQMATIEFGRNVLGLKGANSEEVDNNAKYKVIHIMENQKEYLKNKQYGGTIRLGAWPCRVRKGTILEKSYAKFGGSLENPWYQKNPYFDHGIKPKKARVIYERHRHRYEFNNAYRTKYEENGFVISGLSPDGELVEAIELSNHPFFVGTQFHPEYISRPLSPHPIFLAFIESCTEK
jgi:CTP synthase